MTETNPGFALFRNAPPRLMLITSAPWSTAYRIPFRIAAVEQVSNMVQTFTPNNVVRVVTPAKKPELLATIVETIVPCVFRSVITWRVLVGNEAWNRASSSGRSEIDRVR